MFSVGGHIEDVLAFSAKWDERIQLELQNPERLADAIKALLGEGSADNPHPDALAPLTYNRVFEIDRMELDPSLYELRSGPDGVRIEALVDLTEHDERVAEGLRAGTVRPVLGLVVEESWCGKCGLTYRECPCSKLLDPDCTQQITKTYPAAAYLTPRPQVMGVSTGTLPGA
jgi:hypothetical protein